jgi:hypothetical protein
MISVLPLAVAIGSAMFIFCTHVLSHGFSFTGLAEVSSLGIASQLLGQWDVDSIFSILIGLVFGFSTLNILGLVTRRFENRRSRLNVGEILALSAMALSICFLGWEMLHIFHVFPIQLQR